MHKKALPLIATVFLLGCVSTSAGSGVVVNQFSAEKNEFQSKEFFEINLYAQNTGDHQAQSLEFSVQNTGNLINRSKRVVAEKTLPRDDEKLVSWTFQAPELSTAQKYSPYAKICYDYTSQAYQDIYLAGLEWGGSLPSLQSGSSNAPIKLGLEASNPYKGEVKGKTIKITLNNKGPEELKQVDYITIKVPAMGGKLEVPETSGFFECTHNNAGDYYACTAEGLRLTKGMEKSIRLTFNTYSQGEEHRSARVQAFAYYTYCTKTPPIEFRVKPGVPGQALEGVCSQDSITHCESMKPCLLASGYWCNEGGVYSCTQPYVSGEAPEEVDDACQGVACGNGECESGVEDCENCAYDCACSENDCCAPNSDYASELKGCVSHESKINDLTICCSGQAYEGDCCNSAQCPENWNCYSHQCYQRVQCSMDNQCGSGEKCCEGECVEKCSSNADCADWNGCYYNESLGYETYQVYECEDAGTCDAECVVARTLTQDCECPEGMKKCGDDCVTPECVSDADCEAKQGFIASCVNPNTCVASCVYDPIIHEEEELECGEGLILCSDECVTPTCSSNADCGEGEHCVKPGTCAASCEEGLPCPEGMIQCGLDCVTPECMRDEDCPTGECHNPGTCDAYCEVQVGLD